MKAQFQNDLLLDVFPLWLDSTFGGIPIKVSEKEITLLLKGKRKADSVPQLQKITGRKVVVKSAASPKDKQMYRSRSETLLINRTLAQLDMLAELASRIPDKLHILSPYIGLLLTNVSMMTKTPVEISRGRHRLFTDITGIKGKPGEWSLDLRIGGVLGHSFIVNEKCLLDILGQFRLPRTILGETIATQGIPAAPLRQSGFTISFKTA
jgi:hypothetical protein